MRILEGMVHKPSPHPRFMGSAPWGYFHHNDQEILVDVEGGITISGNTVHPFPCEITFASMCDGGLVATWVDHDLRLARMAMLSLEEPLKDGVTKAALRLSRDTTMVAGSKWCHIIDAEPLALESKGDKIIFALWARGIYCIDSSANELWRLSLLEEQVKTPPRSNEVAAISIVADEVVVWSRDGKYRRISLSDGHVLSEGSLGVDCDLERVFNDGDNFLLSSNDGWAWEFKDGQITVARKLRGTIQDAIHDGNDWKIISWREDIMLRGESNTRTELGVQLVKQNENWLVLDNQGQFSPHLGAENNHSVD